MMARVAKAYESARRGYQRSNHTAIYIVAMALLSFVAILNRKKLYSTGASTIRSFVSKRSESRTIKALTWNIAAINNNPFEYWITNEDPSYNNAMKLVSSFIETPGENDKRMSEIFSDLMYDELEDMMKRSGFNEAHVASARRLWNDDYKNRKIVSEFIKDSKLGKKRLASMPDRVTNTIVTSSGVTFRPTVINCYDGDLRTTAAWWDQWKKFMFVEKISIKVGEVEKSVIPVSLLQPIKSSKYPAITKEEETISLPLQTICIALFDAILVHMMNTVSENAWQKLRSQICTKLNRRKNQRTIEILYNQYSDYDVQFLQEVGKSFNNAVMDTKLSSIYDVLTPSRMDSERDQNSFILLRKGLFVDIHEVTSDILEELKRTAKDAPVMDGDLFAITATNSRTKSKYILASFHGDTNGLATVPVVTATSSFASRKPDYRLLFGMDANTYSKPESDQQGVAAFADFYRAKNLNTCYGQHPSPTNFTTFHARTHLQPQLNKAISIENKDSKGDKNPKDFIMFFSTDFSVLSTKKDNTGKGIYIEGMVFPTLQFPSDHGITSTILMEESTSLRPRKIH